MAGAYRSVVKPQSPFPGEETEAVQSLMAAGRPWVAFEAVQWAPERVDRPLLVALLRTMAQDGGYRHPHSLVGTVRASASDVFCSDGGSDLLSG